MSNNLEYISVDRLLSKFHRDLRGTDINESDAVEWIGEALEFLKVSEVQEQAVAFIEVKNNEADMPVGLQMVLQIARNNEWTEETKEECSITSKKVVDELFNDKPYVPGTCVDCEEGEPIQFDGTPLFDGMEYNPYNDFQWEYLHWTQSKHYKEKYTPIRLANNVFFNSLVCREKEVYENCGEDEYTIVGTAEKKLRFSFESGYIAIAFIRNVVDKETGYPMIPDNISYISAITYYVKWKIAERMSWSGREGYARLAQDSERLWLKYCRQGKNFMKMPKGIDQFQNLLEQSHHMIPRHRRYYGFFGKIGREEINRYNNPDSRVRARYGYGRQ